MAEVPSRTEKKKEDVDVESQESEGEWLGERGIPPPPESAPMRV